MIASSVLAARMSLIGDVSADHLKTLLLTGSVPHAMDQLNCSAFLDSAT